MLQRLFTKCILSPRDIAPLSEGFEVVSTFNPGVIVTGDAVARERDPTVLERERDPTGAVTLLVRVAERPVEERDGWVCSPRYAPGEGVVVDWFPSDSVVFQDPRAFESKETGNVRLTFISHLRVFRSVDGHSVEETAVRFEPEVEEEEYGVEDPRITRLDGRYYFTYVAVSRHGACTALASTRDFKTFERHGVILPSENKDVLLFPEKIGGQYMALHRPNPRYQFSPPEMWLAESGDLIHWGGHRVLHVDASSWGTGRIGGGVPPLRTGRGWLEIYHGNTREPGGGVGPYVAGALMLDGENPGVVVGQTREPIFAPEAEFERSGSLNQVVFPTGLVEREGVYQIFYGAADAYTGVVELRRDDVLGAIEGHL